MWQLVFAYVVIERGVLNKNEHCFLYSPGLAMDFLVHNVKLIRVQWNILLWYCVDVLGRGLLDVL